MTTTEPTTLELDFAVDGMTCASCVRRVEQALDKVDGVHQASVNLATERAHVAIDPDLVTTDRLAKAVTDAGYTPGVISLPGTTSLSAAPAEPAGEAGEVTFDIEGMTCASCVRRVETALDKHEGVKEASVNLATERATVTFDPAKVQVVTLARAVEAAGYGARPLAREQDSPVVAATRKSPT